MKDRPRFLGVQPPPQLLELSDRVRRVIENMVRVDEDSPELAEIRDEMESLAGRLERLGRKGDVPRMLPEMEPGPDDMRPWYPSDAGRWHVNPMNPPLQLHFEAGVLSGDVELGLAWEGPPGCVHGGVVAMLLDQLLGHANIMNDVPALTGELRVRYRRPTPLHEPLHFEIQPPERQSDRRIHTRGELRAGGVVTAEAEGIFVLPEIGRVTLPIDRASLGLEKEDT